MKIHSGSLGPKAFDLKKVDSEQKEEKPLKDIENVKGHQKEETLRPIKVSLSSRARDFEKAKALALREEESADREEKIARLQKLIDEGKYTVDADKVAQNLLKEHLLMND